MFSYCKYFQILQHCKLLKSARVLQTRQSGLHTTANNYVFYPKGIHVATMEKQSKILKKLMTTPKKKVQLYNKVNAGSSINQELQVGGKPTRRRRDVLNALFQRYISDLLSSGEVSPDLIGRGIEVTGVKVNPNFSRAEVFWYCSQTENGDEIGVLLNDHAGILRSLLCNLHLIGQVPFIVFVKDTFQQDVQQVHYLLSTLDLGTDDENKSPDSALTDKTKEKTEISLETYSTDPIIGTESSLKLKNNIYGLERMHMLKNVEEFNANKANSVPTTNKHRASTRVEMQHYDQTSSEKLAEFVKKQKLNKRPVKEKNPINVIDIQKSSSYEYLADESVENEDDYLDEYNESYEYDNSHFEK